MRVCTRLLTCRANCAVTHRLHHLWQRNCRRRHGIARNRRKKGNPAGDEKLVVRFSERDCIIRHYTISPPSSAASSPFSTSQLVSPNISGSSMQYPQLRIVTFNRTGNCAYIPSNTRVQRYVMHIHKDKKRERDQCHIFQIILINHNKSE